MRIISGIAKGRKLVRFSDRRIRPTSDRVRESIFNILPYDLKNKRVLDLCAGTGSLGIEALSRGAKSAVFVDKSSSHLIKKNLIKCGFLKNSKVLVKDVIEGIRLLDKKGEKFDIIFIDPPYNNKELFSSILKKLGESSLYGAETIIIIENFKKAHFIEDQNFKVIDTRIYGSSSVFFIKPKMRISEEL